MALDLPSRPELGSLSRIAGCAGATAFKPPYQRALPPRRPKNRVFRAWRDRSGSAGGLGDALRREIMTRQGAAALERHGPRQ